MIKSYQRLVVIGLILISLIFTGILFTLPEHNLSEATSALSDNGEEMKLPYYRNSIDNLPSDTHVTTEYTVLFFSAQWDSYSLRLEEMLRSQLANYNHLQIVELDISDFRAQALAFNANQPPVVILLNTKGGELGRVTTALTADLEKLLQQLPKENRL